MMSLQLCLIVIGAQKRARKHTLDLWKKIVQMVIRLLLRKIHIILFVECVIVLDQTNMQMRYCLTEIRNKAFIG
jgi:hypothetical protein